LHEDFAGRGLGAVHHREPGHAFPTDDCDFRLPALTTTDGHDGSEAALNEVDGLDASVCRLHAMPEWERH
jgi:hypothetical protein